MGHHVVWNLFTDNSEERSASVIRVEGLRSSRSIYHSNIWGGGSNWVHSALRPSIGLLCLPRVIMMMGKLVE
jgi:hypothetical protein